MDIDFNNLGEEYIAGVGWEEVEIDDLSSESKINKIIIIMIKREIF